MFLPINIFRPAAFCTGPTRFIPFDYFCLILGFFFLCYACLSVLQELNQVDV